MGTSHSLYLAFLLTLLAGLSTGIGSLLAFAVRRTNTAFLSYALGFSAGVMIYVSMVEIFPQAQKAAVATWGDNGLWIASGAFFAGMIFIALIDSFVPSQENPHEVRLIEDMNEEISPDSQKKLLRTGLMAAFAIAIHNFPEGMATFVSVLHDPQLGLAIAVAIAIHNIPEGIAVSIPIYYATGNRRKAFFLSFLSGLSEPAGAVIAYLILMPFMNDIVFSMLFASVAGIMVFISLDELLPAAREYGEPHFSVYGIITGMMIMALSLLLL